MYKFKELDGLTRAATIAIWIYSAIKLLLALTEVLDLDPNLIGLTATLSLIALLATAIIFGCWTYRASANAHVITDGLSISPGWAVGWYFVPLMSLFQPYIAMKETWLASNYGSNWGDADVPGFLPLWWGSWLVGSFMGYGIALSRSNPALMGDLTLVTALLTLVASFALTRIMAQVREGQRITRHAEVFA